MTNGQTPRENKKAEKEMRRRIAAFLPDAIVTAISSYRDFYGAEQAFETAKDFSAHHSACKAAIAHIELLIKLAKWADLPDQNGHKEDDARLAQLLMDAQKELYEAQVELRDDNA